jgi:tetratricopeptide (TPR) repeat protein
VRWSLRSMVRVLARTAQLVLTLLLLWQGARLTFRPDGLDDLRHADALFAAGRYHSARAAYTAVVARSPRLAPALLRLGIVYAVRNERAAANEQLAYALDTGLSQADYELARLYQGWLAAQAGQRDQAMRYWATIGEHSAWLPLRRSLEAENLLALADYANAEASYRAAAAAGLPSEWRALVATRLALLRASSDPAAALAELKRVDRLAISLAPDSMIFATPLLPAAEPSAGQLAEVLLAPIEQRPQLLGQLYLHAQLFGLAEAQFATVAPGSPRALAAATYAAYSRWLGGDRVGGLQRLQNLVAAHPTDSRARAVLALAYLSAQDVPGAQAQLEIMRAQAPHAPATHLAWAQWYAAQHDYLAATAEYRLALNHAAPDERGAYALALARLHVDIALGRCENGLPAAQAAARALPNDPRAWTTLARLQFDCGDPAGSRAAAEQALQRAPASAEASYYLGRALAALGDRPAARLALINAADLAPRSLWRERAEAQIATLGL